MADNRWIQFARKLKPYYIKKGFRYLKHFGVKEFMVRLAERTEPEEVPYNPWFESHKASPEKLQRQRAHRFKHAPLISIVVPAYRTPEVFLRQMIDSVIAQSYENWELCIANGSPEDEAVQRVLREYAGKDKRVKYRDLAQNLGIAGNTNAAFEMASGDFVGLLDHDDLLAPNALYEIVSIITEDETVDAVYTDEDKVRTDLSEHFQPHFKPDFNIDLLRSNNYICHFFAVRRSLMERVGGFRTEFDGAQDYDYIFRCTEQARKTAHVAEILYHWRVHEASTADNPASKMYAFEAGKRAIEEHLKRCGETGEVTLRKDLGFYRVKYPVQGSPLVSVLIPNKDQSETLKTCLESLKKTAYPNYEIIIIENNSSEEQTYAYYKELKRDPKVRIVRWEQKGFNYSALNNFGAKFAEGEYLLFLNNDIEAIKSGWMEELLANCQRKNVGIVGAKLYYPDDTVQHAGTIVGLGGIAGHAFINLPRARSGYLHKASLQMDLSAVTAACMMMKRSVFDEIGGFEEQLAVAFNDVDLCLRTVQAGYLVVYNPEAQLYHHESKSRGAEDSEEKVRRFQSEIEFMRTRWIQILKNGDPNYNKNLTLSKWNYSLRV